MTERDTALTHERRRDLPGMDEPNTWELVACHQCQRPESSGLAKALVLLGRIVGAAESPHDSALRSLLSNPVKSSTGACAESSSHGDDPARVDSLRERWWEITKPPAAAPMAAPIELARMSS